MRVWENDRVKSLGPEKLERLSRRSLTWGADLRLVIKAGSVLNILRLSAEHQGANINKLDLRT
jgi:hypothetical protein